MTDRNAQPVLQFIDAIMTPPQVAEARKADGIKRMQDREGFDAAVEAAAALCRDLRTIDSDLLRLHVDLSGLSHHNQVGAIMHTLARRGIIRETGRFIKSTRAAGNRRRIAVWESLVYKGANHE